MSVSGIGTVGYAMAGGLYRYNIKTVIKQISAVKMS